ncbi:MAG: hypothetical protein QM723_34350 [Myxococcaceae bacterium]
MTLKEAGRLLSVSVSTVERMIGRKEMQTVLLMSRRLVPMAEIERLATPPVPKSAVTRTTTRRSAMSEADKMRARLKRSAGRVP